MDDGHDAPLTTDTAPLAMLTPERQIMRVRQADAAADHAAASAIFATYHP